MRSTTTVSSMLLVVLLLLQGCASSRRARAEPEVRTVEVAVPVPIGCVRARPAPVRPLAAAVPIEQWRRRAPGAKAQAVRAQAGRRMNHADALAAATSGCPEAPGQVR